MFSRNVLISVRPAKHQRFHQAVARQVLDLMRRQEGFVSVTTFVDGRRNGVTATAMWDSKAHADRFEELANEQLAQILDTKVRWTPKT